MRSQTSACVSKAELTDFLVGRVDELRSDQISAHVDGCDTCQETVQSLDRDAPTSDSFLERLPSPTAGGQFEREPQCREVVEQLRRSPNSNAPPPVAPPTDYANLRAIGPYWCKEVLGHGGMGVVYKAWHTKLKRHVAIKLLVGERLRQPQHVARFEREMELVGQLDHPNIVRASDAGEENGLPYLVMEFVDGLDLSALIRRNGRLSMADACELIRQAAMALQHASDHNLVHRDIKPSNLMLSKRGQVKLLDMGLAMLDDIRWQSEGELTTVGQLMGTLDYMSPEQGQDSREVDSRSDIYSLGATLFKLLTGRAPFEVPELDTPMKKMTALATRAAPGIGERRPGLPDELAEIVRRMLAHDPGERYREPREVAEALEPFTEGANLPALCTASLKKPAGKQAVEAVNPLLLAGGKGASPFAARRRWRPIFWAAACLALFAVAAAGVLVIQLTDRGQLIVEGLAPDVTVTVQRTDQDLSTNWRLEQARNSVTLWSGRYQIKLSGPGADGLHIVNGSAFEVRRGKRVVARVRRRPPPRAARGMEMGAGGMGEGGGMEGGGIGGGSIGVGPGAMGEGMSGMSAGAAPPGMAPGRARIGEMGAPGMSAGGDADFGEGGFGGGMRAGVGGAGLDGGEGLSGLGGAGLGAAGSGAAGSGGAGLGGAGLLGGLGGGPSFELLYDGRTFRQWRLVFRTERKPERLIDAVNAVVELGREDQARAAATAIVEMMRRYDVRVKDNAQVKALKDAALSACARLKPEGCLPVYRRELEQGNDNGLAFVLRGVRLVAVPSRGGRPDLQVVYRALVPQLLKVAAAKKKVSDENRAEALLLASDLDPDHELLRDTLESSLFDETLSVRSVAIERLVEISPESGLLLKAVIQTLEKHDYSTSPSDASRALDATLFAVAEMNSKAKAAIPGLTRLLTESPGLEKVYNGRGLHRLAESPKTMFRSNTRRSFVIKLLKQFGPAAKPAKDVLKAISLDDSLFDEDRALAGEVIKLLDKDE